MKYLIDAQLPDLLSNVLIGLGIEALHVNALPNGDESTDSEIQAFADANYYMLITKDKDFYQSHILYQRPKKLFFVSSGNLKNRALFDLFRKHSSHLLKLEDDINFIELTNNLLIFKSR